MENNTYDTPDTKLETLVKQGLQLHDKAKVDLRGELTVGKNVKVDINGIFKGKVVLEDDVVIGPNCIIENTTIKKASIIKENTSIESATVESYCSVGPYARLRPGSQIGERSQIGNFVEIKNTIMGHECKINHHSFVGDSQLGDKVIIAAGVITCNYDGWKSNPTIIEDEAFVGTNVTLIAPITIGKQAFIAAGSTITTDVPEKVLAVCRTKEVVFKPLPTEKN